MSNHFEFKVEWQPAPGVTTPELAATWARYEIRVGNRCVTQVEATDGTFRRSVYGSLYPLAYWIASNWWLLTSHIRPTAVESSYWTWRNVRTQPLKTATRVSGRFDLRLMDQGLSPRRISENTWPKSLTMSSIAWRRPSS